MQLCNIGNSSHYLFSFSFYLMVFLNSSLKRVSHVVTSLSTDLTHCCLSTLLQYISIVCQYRIFQQFGDLPSQGLTRDTTEPDQVEEFNPTTHPFVAYCMFGLFA